MLHQEMRNADFAGFAIVGEVLGGGGVVDGHICFHTLWIGARGGLPPRLFAAGVEVIGEVFGVGVPDFPAGGEAGFGVGHG